MNSFRFSVGLAMAAFLIPSAPAQTSITTLPYVISKPGVYRLTGNLKTEMTTGAAITIQAANVTLDLGGFQIYNLPIARATTSAVGIYSNNNAYLNIRNGQVLGFYYGIMMDGPSAASTNNNVDNIINGIRLDCTVHTAIYMNNAQAHKVTGCIISNTGYTSTNVLINRRARGIYCKGTDFSGCVIADNQVVNTGAHDLDIEEGSGGGIFVYNGVFVLRNQISRTYTAIVASDYCRVGGNISTGCNNQANLFNGTLATGENY